MSLLKNLNPFAVGNYPAGANPWSSQPMRVVPANSYVTPEATRPAETDNYLFGSIIDSFNANNTITAILPVKNWKGSLFASSATINGINLSNGTLNVAASGKDANGNNNYFVSSAGVASTSANSLQILYSRSGGSDFSNTSFPVSFRTASSTTTMLNIVADNAGNAMAILPNGVLNADLTAYFFNSGVWGAASNQAGLGGGAASSAGSSGYYDTVNLRYTINTNNGAIGVYTIPVGSTTFTLCPASSPPAGSANVSSTILLFGNGVGFQIPRTQTSTGWAHVWRYTNPATAGTHTYPGFAIAIADICEAADFSAIDGFMVSVWNGTNTYFMASSLVSNGTTWAATAGTIAGVHIVGLICLGYTWIAIDGSSNVYYSLDFGTTWTKANLKISDTLTAFAKGTLIRNQDATQAFAFGLTGTSNIYAGYVSETLG